MNRHAGEPTNRGARKRGRDGLDTGRRGGMASVGDALSQYMQVTGLGAKIGDFRILEAWKVAVGEAVSRRARAVSFRRGELTVEVESAAHLHELKSFTGEAFRAKANEHLGGQKIRRVSFKLKR